MSPRTLLAACVAGVALTAAGVTVAARAETAVFGKEASECDIAASLGIAKPDCPAVTKKPRTRGLAIGNIDAMPKAPPQAAQPASMATAPKAIGEPAAPASAPALTPSALGVVPQGVVPQGAMPKAAPVPAPAMAAQPSALPAPQAPRKAAFRIEFEFGSSALTGESKHILDRLAAVLTASAAGSVRFLIAGHTDAVGSDSANLALSERRAKAVMDYLIYSHGVSSSRLEAVGRGETEPLIPANPAAAGNRRVEIINLGT